jgi:hypothetical protein
MKVSDMIRKLEALDPEAKLRFFIIPDLIGDDVEKGQIFVEDISASQESVEVLLG